MSKITLQLAVVFLMISCASTKKYNQHIDQTISIQDLKRDVDFVEKKIKKLHPSSDWYISEADLAFKFDSIRNLLTKPLTPNEFN
jgi:hypothetical protein